MVHLREPWLILVHQQRQAQVEDLDDRRLLVGGLRPARPAEGRGRASVIIRFDGLMSRCTIPCDAMYSSPTAAWRITSQASGTESGPSSLTSSSVLTPLTYSITR